MKYILGNFDVINDIQNRGKGGVLGFLQSHKIVLSFNFKTMGAKNILA
ncbi:MAG: hypothetical protein ABJK28_10745 [Algibacter sp.]